MSLQTLWQSDLGVVVGSTVRGDDALALWRSLADGDGYPLIVGDLENVVTQATSSTRLPFDRSKAIAETLDPPSLIAGWRSELDEHVSELAEEGFDIVGEWPANVTRLDGITLTTDIRTGEPLDTVTVAQLPIGAGWTSAAFLSWGGWNACPGPEEHTAIHRYWWDAYGAQPVAVSGDVFEFVVGRPPTSRETAMALAWEQFGYCNDIVDQGVGTVSKLAAALIDSPFWYFWWD
ncbi:MAG TPA: DUF4253 domain-containing protein [Acidimicrobiales bacterium]|nr:DUF4253 domain-containing protein [Acidimicrobiales bacterium]